MIIIFKISLVPLAICAGAVYDLAIVGTWGQRARFMIEGSINLKLHALAMCIDHDGLSVDQLDRARAYR